MDVIIDENGGEIDDKVFEIPEKDPGMLSQQMEYKKQGFYYAIELQFTAQQDTDYRTHLDSLIDAHRKEYLLREDNLESIYRPKIERLEEYVAWVKREIEEEETRKILYLTEIDRLNESIIDLNNKLSEIKNKQLALKSAIAERKRDLWSEWLDKRIKELTNEIDQLVELSLTIAHKKDEVHPLNKEERNLSSQEIKEDWDDLKSATIEQHELAKSQVNNFMSRGFGIATIKYLFFIGFVASGLLGLFSVKLYEEVSQTQTPTKFMHLLFQGAGNIKLSFEVIIGTILNVILPASVSSSGFTSAISSIIFIITCLILLIGLVVLVGVIARWARKDFWWTQKNEKGNNISLEINEQAKVNYKAAFNTQDFYSFWRQITPILILLIFVGVVLGSLMLAADQINEYFNSLIIQLMAFTLVPIGGSIVFFMYLVPPALKDIYTDGEPWFYQLLQKYRGGIIAILVLVFIVSVIASMMTIEGGTFIYKIHNLSNAIVYLTLCLVTLIGGSWALGFAARLNSVFSTETALREEIIRLSHISERYRGRYSMQLVSLGRNDLHQKLRGFEDELAELISIKNIVSKELAIDYLSNNYRVLTFMRESLKELSRSLLWSVRRVLNIDDHNMKLEDDVKYRVSDALRILRLRYSKTWKWIQGQRLTLEERYLEEYHYVFDEYGKERKMLEDEIESAREQVTNLRAGDHAKLIKMGERIKELWKDRNNKEGEIMECRREWNKYLILERHMSSVTETALKEGYNLGLTYLKYLN